MRGPVVCFALLLAHCSSNLDVPRDVVMTCASSRECPEGHACAPLDGFCIAANDATAPRFVSAVALGPTTVTLAFDEPMSPSILTDTSLYAITPPLAVERVLVDPADFTTATLTTFTQAGGVAYTLRAQVRDLAANVLADDSVAAFHGFGVTADAAPPNILAPSSGAILSTTHVVVAVSPRFGAHAYTVQVATDAEFATLVDARFLTEGETSVAFDLAPDLTYYVRARSDATPLDVWGSSHFAVLLDRVFVSCEAAINCASGAAAHAGTKNDPHTTPQAGIDKARLIGASTVAIAARDNAEPYDSTVFLIGGGIDLLGGYLPGFAESQRDTVANRAIILGSDQHQFVAMTKATHVEGLHFGLADDVTAANVMTISVAAGAEVSDTPVFTDVDVVRPFNNATALEVRGDDDEHGPLFVRCLLQGSFGVLVPTHARVTLRESAVVSSANAVLMLAGVLTSESCRFQGASTLGGQATVTNSILTGMRTIDQVSSAPIVIAHSLLIGGLADAVVSLRGSHPVALVNDLIVCDAPTTVGVLEATTSADPWSMQNTVVSGCSTAYVDENTTSVSDPNTLNGQSIGAASCSDCAHSVYASVSVAAVGAADLFMDTAGVDGDVRTLSDGDYRPVTTSAVATTISGGGRDTTSASCGSDEVQLSCGDVTLAIDGAARTPPVAIGPYEVN